MQTLKKTQTWHKKLTDNGHIIDWTAVFLKFRMFSTGWYLYHKAIKLFPDSLHCEQRLAGTHSPAALWAPGALIHCRSFMVILNLSLLNFKMTSSYSGEQSEHLPLPSFSWLTFYCSTQVKIALWIFMRFMLFLQLITEVWFLLMSLLTSLSPLCSPPPFSLLHIFVSKKKKKVVWCVWTPSTHLPALHKNSLLHSRPCR